MIRGRRVVTQQGDHLSEGVLVEAMVRAWLLGAPVLRLEGEVLLSPARPAPVSADLPDPAPAQPPPRLRALSQSPASGGSARIGSALTQAVALVQQSATDLRRGES